MRFFLIATVATAPVTVLKGKRLNPVPRPSSRAANAFGDDVNRRIVALRLRDRTSFAAIARIVGCDETYVRRVVKNAVQSIFVFSAGTPS